MTVQSEVQRCVVAERYDGDPGAVRTHRKLTAKYLHKVENLRPVHLPDAAR